MYVYHELHGFGCSTSDSFVQKHYAKGSEDRQALAAAVEKMQRAGPVDIPLIINGKEVSSRFSVWFQEYRF